MLQLMYLELGSVDGEFSIGETIVGSTSGASYELRIVDVQPVDDGFADNINIETRSRSILLTFSNRILSECPK